MALKESHDIINPPENPLPIWPTAHDEYPVFRNPFYEVPVIPTKDEAFKRYIDSKPEDRPETLHELMKVWLKLGDSHAFVQKQFPFEPFRLHLESNTRN